LTSSAQEAAAARVRELLERIAQTAGVDVSVELHDGPEGLIAEYVGDDLDLLVGQHGETIDAIQHLAYRFAMSGYRERLPVVVDAAGYRERRAETLRATADQAAQAALEQRRAVPLDAMSALERKVIHEHLKDRREIETYSEGQEPSRHLVVAPLVD
jgi:spoIIIJ-associated protein